MKRIPLTDGSNGWFNEETSVKFGEDTRWDGNNHISIPTGSQWDHEALYYTRSGRWVLNEWSQYENTAETYGEISMEEAARWLIQNSCVDDQEQLPADVRQAIQSEVEGLEV